MRPDTVSRIVWRRDGTLRTKVEPRFNKAVMLASMEECPMQCPYPWSQQGCSGCPYQSKSS